MIVLSSATQVLQIVLGGAPAANQPTSYVAFFDENKNNDETKYANQVATANSGNDVTICSAPAVQNFVRCIESVFIYQKDTSPVTITVKLDDATVETILCQQLIPPNRTLCYEHGNGWYMI